jgi:flagellar capping protein FliD
MNTPLTDLLQWITLGGLVSLLVIGYNFYSSFKRKIVEDTKEKAKLEGMAKDIQILHDRITSNKRDMDQRIKDLTKRVDDDKDLIIKKFEEMDNKIENRINKLTELIIDLFKEKK